MTVVVRNTRETQIRVEVVPGTGESEIDTTISFLDHMLVTLARYASLDLRLTARGDLRHHLIEDVAIALGTAVAALVPPARRAVWRSLHPDGRRARTCRARRRRAPVLLRSPAE